MQITILDHDTSHAGKRAGFRFSATYELGGVEYEHTFNFADFAAWLVAAGEFDGYTDNDDEGMVWRNMWPEYAEHTYTFNEFIKEFMMCGDFDGELARFIVAELTDTNVVEDFAMITRA